MKINPTVKDIMTKNPRSVNIKTSILEMINIMEVNEFDHLPVLDDTSQLKGIVTKTDLYKKILSLSKTTSGKSYSEKMINNTTAKDVMTANPIIMTTDQSFELAIEIFYKDDFHALPVLEHNRLVGIITCKDILSAINDMQFNQH